MQAHNSVHSGHGKGGRQAVSDERAKQLAQAVQDAPTGSRRQVMRELAEAEGVHWRTIQNYWQRQFAEAESPGVQPGADDQDHAGDADGKAGSDEPGDVTQGSAPEAGGTGMKEAS